MIECREGNWINPKHVVFVNSDSNGDTKIHLGDRRTFTTDLKLHVVISIIAESNCG